MNSVSAIILGVIEGLTEFLPVSSTGHLIIGSYLLGIVQDDSFIAFEIAIQLGAICAVCAVYWKKILDSTCVKKVALGFLPTGIVGVSIFPYIKPLLTSELTVACMLVLGGVAILFIEKWYATQTAPTREVVTYKDAFVLGCAQCLALVPGVSRSGAVMMMGLGTRLRREAASEFAFLLAIPTMFAATAYTLYKHREILTADVLHETALGAGVAFIVALCVVRLFIGYIRTHTFVPFGWYRICVGLLLLYFFI